MDTIDEFETRVSVAAEAAKSSGYIQTHLALLEILRVSRLQRQIDATKDSENHMMLTD